MKALKVEQYMNDKELLLEAIPNSDLYTISENKILEELIRISIDGVATSSIKYLIKATGLATTTVYVSLKSLQKDGVITKLPTKTNSFKLNQRKLDYIVQIHNNKRK